MVLITSLSPKHINKNIQQKAIDSWVKLGLKCFSFNHPSELPSLRNYKNIIFIEAQQTMKHVFGKHYVTISEMINWARRQESEHFCFINSDIELADDARTLNVIKANLDVGKMVVVNRNDYDKNKSNTTVYHLGIDAFFMNDKHLEIYPPSLLCMGQCFWDYNIPFTAIKNNIEVINLQNKFVFHKKHNVQYSPKNWEITGKYFMLEHGLNQFAESEVGRMNQVTDNFLKLNMKKVML